MIFQPKRGDVVTSPLREDETVGIILRTYQDIFLEKVEDFATVLWMGCKQKEPIPISSLYKIGVATNLNDVLTSEYEELETLEDFSNRMQRLYPVQK